MAENKLIGSLVLRTIDIAPNRNRPAGDLPNPYPYENEFGIFDANGGVVTWKNIDLRACLGELYYKYDRFNLKLTAVQFNPTIASNVDTNFMIYMSGLPFSSGYNTKLGPVNQVAMGCVTMAGAGAAFGIVYPIVSCLVSFYKPLQNKFDITVEFKNSSTYSIRGYSEKNDRLLGHWSIVCNIYGIDKS